MPWALPEPALALQPNGFDNSSGSSSSSGGSSGSSSSSSWEGAAGLFLDPSSSGGGGSARLAIADDLLRLQQRCEAAMQRQHALADQVLSLALVKTSSPQLHPLSRAAHQGWEEVVRSHEIQTVHRLHPTRALTLPTGTSPEQRERRRHHLDQQPWFIDWGQRLAQVRRRRCCCCCRRGCRRVWLLQPLVGQQCTCRARCAPAVVQATTAAAASSSPHASAPARRLATSCARCPTCSWMLAS